MHPHPAAASRTSSSTWLMPMYALASMGGIASATGTPTSGASRPNRTGPRVADPPDLDPMISERERRDRPADVRDVHRHGAAAAEVAEYQADGEGDEHGDEHRRRAHLEVLEQEVRDPLVPRPVLTVGEPGPRPARGTKASTQARCRRSHGSRAAAGRATRRRPRRSRTRRRAASPTVTGVRKSIWKPRVNISWPSPPWPIVAVDGHQPDRRHGGDAHPGHDRRHRERQLDAQEAAASASSPSPPPPRPRRRAPRRGR